MNASSDELSPEYRSAQSVLEMNASEPPPPPPPPPASTKAQSESHSPPPVKGKVKRKGNPNFHKSDSDSPPPVKGKGKGIRKAAEVVDDEALELKTAAGAKYQRQRVWPKDDEIVLIKAMISYFETTEKDPIANVKDLYEIVKSSLSVAVSIDQVRTKAERLKAKFVERVEMGGRARAFPDNHQKEMFDFSDNLWGANSNLTKAEAEQKKLKKKRNPKHPVVSGEEVIVSGGVDSARGGGFKIPIIDEDFMNSWLKKMENKWNDLKMQELDHNLKKMEFGKEMGELVMNAIVSGGVDLRGGGFKIPIMDEDIMNRGLELLSGAKKVELEKKWNDMKVQELKHYLKKMEIGKEMGELFLNAIN